MTRRRLTVTYVLVAVLGGGVVSAGNRGAARLRGQEYDIVLAGGHAGARRALLRHDQSLAGAAALGDTSRTWTHGTLRDAELPSLDTLVDQGLAEGALGVGFGIAYTPGASRQEILHLFRVAARRG